MKSVLYTWLAISLCALFVTSCNNNTNIADQNNSTKAFVEYLGKPIKTDLNGKVLDNDQLPIKEVMVSIENKSVLTDNNGNFTIKNVSAHENLLTIKVVKKDYKNELVNLTSKQSTDTVDIILYKESELNLFWFNKNNHNLPNTIN